MASINVNESMVELSPFNNSDLLKTSDAGPISGENNTRNYPDGPLGRLYQYLKGGTLGKDFGGDIEGLKTSLQLFALDMANAWSRMRKGKFSIVSSPMMPTFMAVPAALVEGQQIEQPVVIDCEDGVRIDAFALTMHGSYLCLDNQLEIQPVEITCAEVRRQGIQVGSDGIPDNDKTGDQCFENDLFYPFAYPPQGIVNRAPLLTESDPAPTVTVHVDTNESKVADEDPILSDYEKTLLRLSALAAGGMLALTALVAGYRLLFHPRGGIGSGYVHVEYDPFVENRPTVKKPPHESNWTRPTNEKVKIAPINQQTLEGISDRVENIVRISSRIKIPREKNNKP